MADQPFKVGDVVTPKAQFAPAGMLGRRFQVEKVNPVNLRCKSLDGGKGLNFPSYALDVYDPSKTPSDLARAALKTIPLPLAEGTVVTLAKAWKDVGTEVPFVVVKDNGDRTSIAPLGGGTNVPALRLARRGVVERDLAWLTSTLRTQQAVSA